MEYEVYILARLPLLSRVTFEDVRACVLRFTVGLCGAADCDPTTFKVANKSGPVWLWLLLLFFIVVVVDVAVVDVDDVDVGFVVLMSPRTFSSPRESTHDEV